MPAYFVRGAGDTWAIIELVGHDEHIIADGLSKETAIEQCAELIERLPRRAVELPLGSGDASPRLPERRRARQLTLKL